MSTKCQPDFVEPAILRLEQVDARLETCLERDIAAQFRARRWRSDCARPIPDAVSPSGKEPVRLRNRPRRVRPALAILLLNACLEFCLPG
jgi:hypothetical protein